MRYEQWSRLGDSMPECTIDLLKTVQNRSKSSKIGSKRAQIDRKRSKFTIESQIVLDHWLRVVVQAFNESVPGISCCEDGFGMPKH